MSSPSHQFAASRIAPAQKVEDYVGVQIDPERRRGRGAGINPSGRYEPQARQRFDDGWGSSDDLPPFKTQVQEERPRQDHHHQPVPRHFLRPLDQSVSRLRARLRLLLRAPDPRLYGPVAGGRFRDAALRQAERGGASGTGTREAGLSAANHGDRHQYRPLPADREALPDHARDPRSAGGDRTPGRHRHQVGACAARHRHPVADGRAQPLQGRLVGDDARPPARPGDGASRRHARAPARRPPPPVGGRDPDDGDGGADHPGAERSRRSSASSTPRPWRASARRATFCSACRSRSAMCSRISSNANIRTGPSTSCR